jgi:hypothetical protein
MEETSVVQVSEKMWELDRVSIQFSVWNSKGIKLSDALYETRLKGFI